MQSTASWWTTYKRKQWSYSKQAKVDAGSEKETDFTKSKAHHAGNGTFVNPWPSARPKPNPGVKVVEPDFNKPAKNNEMKVTWLGHAGVLVQLPALSQKSRPISVVIDPIFSLRCSPSQLAGPARRLPAPCTVDNLPHIDFVLISHNHYDHLDLLTIESLIQRDEGHTTFVVPLGEWSKQGTPSWLTEHREGLRSWFLSLKVPEEQIIELDWWEDASFQPSSLSAFSDDEDSLGSVRISCVPAQHNSARTGLDRATSLWAGFVVEQFAYKASEAPDRTCVYFAGDTGYRAEPDGEYCPAFEQIGKKFGPMDFSAIPIWRGGTLAFVSSFGLRLHHEALTLATHATPDDALCIHSDVKSKSSLAIHFATFSGSEDEATYPVALLEEACIDTGIPMDAEKENGFGVTDIGQTILVPVRG